LEYFVPIVLAKKEINLRIILDNSETIFLVAILEIGISKSKEINIIVDHFVTWFYHFQTYITTIAS